MQDTKDLAGVVDELARQLANVLVWAIGSPSGGEDSTEGDTRRELPPHVVATALDAKRACTLLRMACLPAMQPMLDDSAREAAVEKLLEAAKQLPQWDDVHQNVHQVPFRQGIVAS